MVTGSIVNAVAALAILVANIGLARMLLEKRLISPGVRLLTALLLLICIGLLIGGFWLLGGLRIGLR